MIRPVRCDGCGAFVLMEDSGWLIPHQERLDPKGEICSNREPPKPSIEEYPVGYDSDPWVWSSSFETNRRTH